MLNSNKSKIDIINWKRKDHFNFFKSFEQPFWGINTILNCTQSHAYCSSYGISFFMYYLYHSLKAANHIKEFKCRIENDEVYEYEHIGGTITVLRNDETFGFAYFDYYENFAEFSKHTKSKMTSAKITNGLISDPNLTNLIYFSVLPEIKFTNFQHAQRSPVQNSAPMIVFGQYEKVNGQVLLPISLHVHHALCDGLHVEKFIKSFQSYLELDTKAI